MPVADCRKMPPCYPCLLTGKSPSTISAAQTSAISVAEEALRVAAEAQEELVLLRSLLYDAGLLRPEQLDAELHRRRFAGVLEKYPCELSYRFDDLGEGCIAKVSSFLPGGALEAIKGCSKTIASACVSWRQQSLYILGGHSGSITNILWSLPSERFDPRKQCWEEMPRPLEVRIGSSGAVIDGCLYIAGGARFMGNRNLNSAEKFDPVVGRWEQLPPMKTRRWGAVAAAVNGHFYVVGGNDGADRLNSGESFDPASSTWHPLPPCAQKRHGASCAVLAGSMYVCGGLGEKGGKNKALSSVERLDAILGSWEGQQPMLQSRFGAAAAAMGGCMYVCGGKEVREAPCLASVERFNSASNCWEMMQPLPTALFAPMAAAMAGTLYLCGGNEGNMLDARPRSSEVLRYDVRDGCWKEQPPLLTGRGGGICLAAPTVTGL